MSADGYRFTAEYLRELEAAVEAELQHKQDSVFAVAAAEYTRALAVALERPAGHPMDPSSAA